ncbi:hypothetical protein WN944_000574 [Citrus x changshan-huyou]|uniref:Uncharacterized protein n=1 Tax=Citrus x changshan-huyou TaxID=2935761 RepID=A0AAP0MEV8_9ROSI
MADKPSKALVLYGDGFARFVEPSHAHLHSLASKAACGFLSLPIAPPSESEEERIVREFAVLIDANQDYLSGIGEHTTELKCEEKSPFQTISNRFMGLKAALITTNSRLKSFGDKLGFATLQLNELIETSDSLSGSPIEVMASELLKLLGFQRGKMEEVSQFDLVLVHIGAGEKTNDDKGKAVAHDLEYINALVGVILQMAQPASEVGSRLHLSVVLSYGQVLEADNSNLSVLISIDEKSFDLSALFPRQSYTMKGETSRNDVRHHCPMLISQWQYAVTRKDMAETFSFKDFKEVDINSRASGLLILLIKVLVHHFCCRCSMVAISQYQLIDFCMKLLLSFGRPQSMEHKMDSFQKCTILGWLLSLWVLVKR